MPNPQDALRQQLIHALHNDDFTTIDNLLQQGANVNLPYNHHGWTPFMWFCKEHCNLEKLKQGWQLQGGIATMVHPPRYTVFYQAIVKPTK